MSTEHEQEENFKNKLFLDIVKQVRSMKLPFEEQIYELMNYAWNAGISYEAGRRSR